MSEIGTRLHRIQSRSHLRWTVDGRTVDVELWDGGRRQRVQCEAGPDEIRFWSVVARAAQVTATDAHWRELARRVWRRNAVTELVAFAFDSRDRLVGFIEHPGQTITDTDLELYIEVVARECDHLEYLLSGEDRE